MFANTITVMRLRISNEKETISRVYLDDEFFCFGMEQPWNNNIPFKSCIPKGIYNLVDFSSPKHGETYAIVNEAMGVTKYETGFPDGRRNRYACLIHPANWAKQLQGCLALGDKLIYDADNTHMITNSRNTVEEFMKRISVNTTIEFIDEDDWE